MEDYHFSFSLFARQNNLFCCGNRCADEESSPSVPVRSFDNKDDLKAGLAFYTKWKSGPPPNDWDVSRVQDFSELFKYNNAFNEDIGGWDTSAVTNMRDMFQGSSFNQDIGDWDTSAVTDMTGMFYEAKSFNQDISAWDVSAVLGMSFMFAGASAFNQDISTWKPSSVHTMSYMFTSATAFNQNISAWDTSTVGAMFYMFSGATAFNQDISAWDAANVINMQNMFDSASAFNQNLCPWKNTIRDGVTVTNMFLSTSCAHQPTPSLSGDNIHLSSLC